MKSWGPFILQEGNFLVGLYNASVVMSLGIATAWAICAIMGWT